MKLKTTKLTASSQLNLTKHNTSRQSHEVLCSESKLILEIHINYSHADLKRKGNYMRKMNKMKMKAVLAMALAAAVVAGCASGPKAGKVKATQQVEVLSHKPA
jgi:hypothetical protein